MKSGQNLREHPFAPRALHAFSCFDIVVKHSRAFLIYNINNVGDRVQRYGPHKDFMLGKVLVQIERTKWYVQPGGSQNYGSFLRVFTTLCSTDCRVYVQHQFKELTIIYEINDSSAKYVNLKKNLIIQRFGLRYSGKEKIF